MSRQREIDRRRRLREAEAPARREAKRERAEAEALWRELVEIMNLEPRERTEVQEARADELEAALRQRGQWIEGVLRWWF